MELHQYIALIVNTHEEFDSKFCRALGNLSQIQWMVSTSLMHWLLYWNMPWPGLTASQIMSFLLGLLVHLELLLYIMRMTLSQRPCFRCMCFSPKQHSNLSRKSQSHISKSSFWWLFGTNSHEFSPYFYHMVNTWKLPLMQCSVIVFQPLHHNLEKACDHFWQWSRKIAIENHEYRLEKNKTSYDTGAIATQFHVGSCLTIQFCSPSRMLP